MDCICIGVKRFYIDQRTEIERRSPEGSADFVIKLQNRLNDPWLLMMSEHADKSPKPASAKKSPASPQMSMPEFTLQAPEVHLQRSLLSSLGIAQLTQSTLQHLHQTLGNQGLSQIIEGVTDLQIDPVQRPKQQKVKTARDRVKDAPAWGDNRPMVHQMQTELRRLRLYKMNIDSIYGKGTDSALVEAFGGDEFRTLDAETTLSRLKTALPTDNKKKRFRYGEMFKDGLLDVTVGVGYSEYLEKAGLAPDTYLKYFIKVLKDFEFEEDFFGAMGLYLQAGRKVPKSIFGRYFVKKNVLIYTPPAGAPRPIHAVVRLVSSPDGSQGAQAAAAFREGMAQSDISYYSGHARYGSGMDFDKAYEGFYLINEDGSINDEITDPHKLEALMHKEGRKLGRSAWQQFMWRVNNNRIHVELSNDGNLYLNKHNYHASGSHSFGSRLMYWAIQQKTGGAKLQTGKGNALDKEQQAAEKKYRIVVFNGCTTQNYEKSIRDTPGMGDDNTALITTRQPVLLGSAGAEALASFLASVISQQSAQETIEGMEKTKPGLSQYARTFNYRGTKSDPHG